MSRILLSLACDCGLKPAFVCSADMAYNNMGLLCLVAAVASIFVLFLSVRTAAAGSLTAHFNGSSLTRKESQRLLS